MNFEEMLDKTWEVDVSEKDVVAAHEEVKEVYAISMKALIVPDFSPGRTRLFINDDKTIEIIVLELNNGQTLRVEKPEKKMYDWPARPPRGPRPRDPFGWI